MVYKEPHYDYVCASREIPQRPDVENSEIKDQVDFLAAQLSEVTLIVKKSQNPSPTTSLNVLEKICSFFRESRHLSTSCPL